MDALEVECVPQREIKAHSKIVPEKHTLVHFVKQASLVLGISGKYAIFKLSVKNLGAFF